MTLLLPPMDLLSEQLANTAWQAGLLLRSLRPKLAAISQKDDGSPVTEADTQAEKIILAQLKQNWPSIPVIAEESGGHARDQEFFFLVDPLDGTRDYIRPEGEYTVNIALIHHKRPVAAAIVAPESQSVWIAGTTARMAHVSNNQGDGVPHFSWQPIQTRPVPDEGGIALVSRRRSDHTAEGVMNTLPIASRLCASSAIKFCWVASGKADFYVRGVPTMEWDTAAGDHILARAGGVLFTSGGRPYHYGREDHGYLNGAFAAIGDASLKNKIVFPLK